MPGHNLRQPRKVDAKRRREPPPSLDNVRTFPEAGPFRLSFHAQPIMVVNDTLSRITCFIKTNRPEDVRVVDHPRQYVRQGFKILPMETETFKIKLTTDLTRPFCRADRVDILVALLLWRVLPDVFWASHMNDDESQFRKFVFKVSPPDGYDPQRREHVSISESTMNPCDEGEGKGKTKSSGEPREEEESSATINDPCPDAPPGW